MNDNFAIVLISVQPGKVMLPNTTQNNSNIFATVLSFESVLLFGVVWLLRCRCFAAEKTIVRLQRQGNLIILVPRHRGRDFLGTLN